MTSNDYDMLSNLRDYLEDVVSSGDGCGVEVELDQDELTWILDQIYFAKRHENDIPVEGSEED